MFHTVTYALYESPDLHFYFFASSQIKSNKLQVVVAYETENILMPGVENPLAALIESTPGKMLIPQQVRPVPPAEFVIEEQGLSLLQLNNRSL